MRKYLTRRSRVRYFLIYHELYTEISIIWRNYILLLYRTVKNNLVYVLKCFQKSCITYYVIHEKISRSRYHVLLNVIQPSVRYKLLYCLVNPTICVSNKHITVSWTQLRWDLETWYENEAWVWKQHHGVFHSALLLPFSCTRILSEDVAYICPALCVGRV